MGRGIWAVGAAAMLAMLLALFGLVPVQASGPEASTALRSSEAGSATAPKHKKHQPKANKAKKKKKSPKAKKKNVKAAAKKSKKSAVKRGKAPARPVPAAEPAVNPESAPVAPAAPESSPVAPEPTAPEPTPEPVPIAEPAPAPEEAADETPTESPATQPPVAPGVQDVVRDRAMWLWNWDDNQAVLDFSLANSVKEIFTYAHPGFLNDDSLRGKLADLTSRGSALGIRMWAMGGDPSWVTNQSAALDWVAEVNASGFFDGIHLEIEPHSEAGYWENQTVRNQLYLSLLDQVAAAKGGHTLEISLPWWFHTIGYGDSTLDVAAISAADQVTIVTFNESAAGIESNAQQAAAIAESQNKPYRLASETNWVPDADWITFSGQSNEEMLAVQDEVSEALLDSPGYLGFAVHDYTGWAELATA